MPTTSHKQRKGTSMKAFDILKEFYRAKINPGSTWLKSNYKLTVYKGKLNPRKWYYQVFNKDWFYDEADVVLTLGTNEKQYLFEIDR